MDTDVLALMRRAECELRQLLADADRRPDEWAERRRLLVALERIASDLVEASRRYAEQLSREAGHRRGGHPTGDQ